MTSLNIRHLFDNQNYNIHFNLLFILLRKSLTLINMAVKTIGIIIAL